MESKINRYDFFYDQSASDNIPEILLDYWLSWIFRCSEEQYKKTDAEVNKYSRKILLNLLLGKNNESGEFKKSNVDYDHYIIENVVVEKQKNFKNQRIDLFATIKVKCDNLEKTYLLVIENKVYSRLSSPKQLWFYKECTEEDKNYKEMEKQYIFLTANAAIDSVTKEKCKEAGFQYLTFGNLKEIIGEVSETGNTLFDEFSKEFFRYDN